MGGGRKECDFFQKTPKRGPAWGRLHNPENRVSSGGPGNRLRKTGQLMGGGECGRASKTGLNSPTSGGGYEGLTHHIVPICSRGQWLVSGGVVCQLLDNAQVSKLRYCRYSEKGLPRPGVGKRKGGAC